MTRKKGSQYCFVWEIFGRLLGEILENSSKSVYYFGRTAAGALKGIREKEK